MENDAEQVDEDKGKESEDSDKEDKEEEFKIEFEIVDDKHEKAVFRLQIAW